VPRRPEVVGVAYAGWVNYPREAVVPNVGPLEIVIVLIIALIVLGPKRLPDFGRSVGRGLREFKGALSGDSSEDRELDERRRDTELEERERRLEERERELERRRAQSSL
jgi:sec-independent protein translocase protein TatA